jgi:hypothetical protein
VSNKSKTHRAEPIPARCMSCSRRCRSSDATAGTWNKESIAGLVIGVLCPDCQTVEQDLEAQVRQVLDPQSQHKKVYYDSGASGECLSDTGDYARQG